MGTLSKIDQAQLSSALTVPAASLRKSLSKEDSSALLALMEALARRYPGQDLESTIGEFHRDYEALALKYSLAKMIRAVEELRIDPNQKFFPKPDEIAERIEQRRETGLYADNAARYKKAQAQHEQDRVRIEAFKKAWLESGLTLAEYCKRLDDEDNAALRDRLQAPGQ